MAESSKLSWKEIRRRERNRKQLVSGLFLSAVAILVAVALGYVVWEGLSPKPGVSIQVMTSTRHIEVGEQHEAYNSDPPTSGPHYAQPASAGFYDEALPDEQLVHNLEHGYVVIWYNCKGLEETACEALKTQIRSVMDQAGGVGISSTTKLIAVPRSSLPGTLAASSWGRLYEPESFRPDELLFFIKEFRNKAPEPNAP